VTSGGLTDAGASVPTSIGHVTAAWLTSVLRNDDAIAGTATVTDVRAEQIALDSGFSSLLYRAHLTGDGVPASVIVKLPAESDAGGAMRMLGGYRREVDFYRHVAGGAPMGTPRVYTARMAGDDGDFVLVLEDLRDWDNVDHLAGVSVERARICMQQLAGLHAWSLEPEQQRLLDVFPSLDSPFTRDLLPSAFKPAWQIYREKATIAVPPALDAYVDRFTELAPVAIGELSRRSMLIHGDIRADNMFFRGEQLKVVDFQLAATACGATDVGYLVSQGIPTQDRAGRDEELVRDYVDMLVDLGVTDYSFDEAWRHYRFAVAYWIVLPAMPLLAWDGLPERSRRLCMRLVDRAVATIDEINALEVFA
jgi:hypothetical protein